MTQSFALISIQRDPEEPVVRFSLPEGTCLWPSRSVSGCYSGTAFLVPKPGTRVKVCCQE